MGSNPASSLPPATTPSAERSLTISVDPDHGDHSTVFAGAASGFTPNGKVTVSATKPDGQPYPTTYPKTADANGAFTWSWQWDPGDTDGTWTIKFLDHTTGKTTSTTLTITASATTTGSGRGRAVNPKVSVSPTSGNHSTLFSGTASGFTPNGKVTVSATKPDGQPYPNTYPKTADANGAFTWSWQWDPGDTDGTWTIKFLDHTTAKTTSTTLTITASG